MNAAEKRRRLLESAVLRVLETFYVYQSGDSEFKNITHRSETYEGLIPDTYYDACSIEFGDEYFTITNSAHQNATEKIYYFYFDVTGYEKILVTGVNPSTSSETGESRVGVFSSDGLKASDFTDETSKKIGFSLTGPKSYEFDVADLNGTKVLAFYNSSRYAQPQIYEIRME